MFASWGVFNDKDIFFPNFHLYHGGRLTGERICSNRVFVINKQFDTIFKKILYWLPLYVSDLPFHNTYVVIFKSFFISMHDLLCFHNFSFQCGIALPPWLAKTFCGPILSRHVFDYHKYSNLGPCARLR